MYLFFFMRSWSDFQVGVLDGALNVVKIFVVPWKLREAYVRKFSYIYFFCFFCLLSYSLGNMNSVEAFAFFRGCLTLFFFLLCFDRFAFLVLQSLQCFFFHEVSPLRHLSL